ncbi:hypothetical protein C8R45DRAFT_1072561 [Mycena sanguinolenta]|nr:hypothetical protein C8R45DRAFT_1072561 [Mycena sanguinolenta]
MHKSTIRPRQRTTMAQLYTLLQSMAYSAKSAANTAQMHHGRAFAKLMTVCSKKKKEDVQTVLYYFACFSLISWWILLSPGRNGSYLGEYRADQHGPGLIWKASSNRMLCPSNLTNQPALSWIQLLTREMMFASCVSSHLGEESSATGLPDWCQNLLLLGSSELRRGFVGILNLPLAVVAWKKFIKKATKGSTDREKSCRMPPSSPGRMPRILTTRPFLAGIGTHDWRGACCGQPDNARKRRQHDNQNVYLLMQGASVANTGNPDGDSDHPSVASAKESTTSPRKYYINLHLIPVTVTVTVTSQPNQTSQSSPKMACSKFPPPRLTLQTKKTISRRILALGFNYAKFQLARNFPCDRQTASESVDGGSAPSLRPFRSHLRSPGSISVDEEICHKKSNCPDVQKMAGSFLFRCLFLNSYDRGTRSSRMKSGCERLLLERSGAIAHAIRSARRSSGGRDASTSRDSMQMPHAPLDGSVIHHHLSREAKVDTSRTLARDASGCIKRETLSPRVHDQHAPSPPWQRPCSSACANCQSVRKLDDVDQVKNNKSVRAGTTTQMDISLSNARAQIAPPFASGIGMTRLGGKRLEGTGPECCGALTASKKRDKCAVRLRGQQVPSAHWVHSSEATYELTITDHRERQVERNAPLVPLDRPAVVAARCSLIRIIRIIVGGAEQMCAKTNALPRAIESGRYVVDRVAENAIQRLREACIVCIGLAVAPGERG